MQGTHGKKLLKKFLIASLAVGVINFSPMISYENNLQMISVVHAEIRTYEAVGRAEFNFGENNPQLVEMAKNYARMDAEQNAKEKAGIYLKSFSRSLGGSIADDDISVVANNSAEILDVKFKQMPYVSHDVQGNETGEIGIAYEATVTVKIDSDELSKYIQRDQQEKFTLIEQNKSSLKNIADINKQVEELKNDPQKATSAEIEKINNEILAQQKFDEGIKLIDKYYDQAAIQKFTEEIKLNPNYSDAYNKRGRLYDYLKEYEQAIKDYSKVIELIPDDDSAYSQRGMAYFRLKEYEQAIKDYSKVIELIPDDDSAYYCRGLAYSELKNYEQAIKDYSKAIRLNPNSLFHYLSRGETYYYLKKYKQAIKDFDSMIGIDSTNDPSAYFCRGMAYFRLKEYEQAIKDYSKVIELYPIYSDAYHWRGECYRTLGQTEKAEKDFAKARELGYNG